MQINTYIVKIFTEFKSFDAVFFQMLAIDFKVLDLTYICFILFYLLKHYADFYPLSRYWVAYMRKLLNFQSNGLLKSVSRV